MKISYNWLKEYINIDINADELSRILTDIGLEVEGVETFEEVKGGLKGMVIGHVLTCEKHPNADKLSKTTVDVGTGSVLNIVCGAPNVAAGQKVVVATIGAELFHSEGSFVIKKTKIRGEVSEGMICAEDELGLGTSHDGIMVLSDDAVVGSGASDYFNIKTDTVFEIGLTPNRIDAASHFGVARDLAAYFSLNDPKELKKPSVDNFKVDNTSNEVVIESVDSQACKRYAGLTMSGLKVAPSPKWLQLRLQAIGLSPINNIVDATNYVLHELAQPLHAFDADKLAGKKIIVKKLPEGTPFVTLDEVERKLGADDLMICDAENPACIGGVFGGIHSGVTGETTSIFLESAYFDPVHIRKTAKKHGLSTDASFRFERGIDPDITIHALKRAAMLIKEIAGGEITSEITDVYPGPIPFHEVKVKYAHINRLIGKNIDRDTIEKIVTSLEMEYVSDNCEEMHLKIPPYRVDVTREADVIEDILRLYGYNNVEFSSRMVSSISPSQKPDNEKLVNRMSDFLASAGFNEIMSNSLQKSDYY
ncbi:MAG: phenylalanine--tRNA ligase subunit beta, partial [Bacteroidales bacterium]|nr:phenylalanine--tRNA ligase subunit beta [Bacteroidales bacterium]